MNDIIRAACDMNGISESDLLRKHPPKPTGSIRPMLWYLLIREMRFSHRMVARRFGYTRRNVLWAIRSLSDAMEVHPYIRAGYEAFAAALRGRIGR